MRELVHFDGNNISFSAAVVRVAESLSPLAAARDITAAIGACVVEVAQIDLERKRLASQGQALSAYLANRQREVASVFAAQRSLAMNVELDRKEMRRGLAVIIDQSRDRFISEDERQIFAALIPVMASQLVEAARGDAQGLVRLIDALNLRDHTRRIESWT